MPKYLVKTGLEFPPDRRVEAGEIVEDIPAKSIKWLREQGMIELVDATVEKEVVESKKVEKEVVELKKTVSKTEDGK
jgi:CRISPR/Cas system-associated exonuclease Cas4 (RecB family)